MRTYALAALCALLLVLPVMLDLAEPAEVVEAVHPGLLVVRLARRTRRKGEADGDVAAIDCPEAYAADDGPDGPGGAPKP